MDTNDLEKTCDEYIRGPQQNADERFETLGATTTPVSTSASNILSFLSRSTNRAFSFGQESFSTAVPPMFYPRKPSFVPDRTLTAGSLDHPPGSVTPITIPWPTKVVNPAIPPLLPGRSSSTSVARPNPKPVTTGARFPRPCAAATDPTSEAFLRLVETVTKLSENVVETKAVILRAATDFQMPSVARFDGIGCPKSHLLSYYEGVIAQKVSSEVMAAKFHLTRKGAAREWLVNQDPSEVGTWEKMSDLFLKRYESNGSSKEDLENFPQRDDETFSEFADRWNEKVTGTLVRPHDEIALFLRNLNRTYGDRMKPASFESFGSVLRLGRRVEEAIRKGFRSGYRVYAPLSVVFRRLVADGKLAPVEGYVAPSPLPKKWDPSKHCEYHGCNGHDTDDCGQLYIAIHDLIDMGTMYKPTKSRKKRKLQPS